MFNNLEDNKIQENASLNNKPMFDHGGTKTEESSVHNNVEIDDIFAETDKVSEVKAPGGVIEANKVGLTAGSDKIKVEKYYDNHDSKDGKGNWFKIVVVAIVIVIVVLASFLLYKKFFKAATDDKVVVDTGVDSENIKKEIIDKKIDLEEKKEAKEAIEKNDDKDSKEEIPIVILPKEEVFVPVTDSDEDGLNDSEEIAAGTNINVIDTDNDSLSDYEEIKIYKTNPLNSDTDGDGYQDGVEVRGGYNPNGDGKLVGNN